MYNDDCVYSGSWVDREDDDCVGCGWVGGREYGKSSYFEGHVSSLGHFRCQSD